MSRRPDPEYAADWRTQYAHLVSSPEQAVQRIRPGNRIFIGTGCAQPLALVRALVAQRRKLVDTTVVHLLTLGEAPYATHELSEHFRVNSFFIAENVRDTVQQGLGDYTPIFLSDIPRLFQSGQLPLDVALIQVTPPDVHGRCSLGISVDITKAAAENAALVIAQVNPQMPWTTGDSFLHVHDIDALVPVEAPLLEAEPPAVSDVTRRIARHVASLVDDGSTVEVGIGQIPQAVLEFLKDKRDLGIHTEMFTDAIIDMVESGTVNGLQKSIDRGKAVASFCLGTRKLYDYIHNNPSFSFYPTEYVNDPFVIGRQNKMVAINVALEVDLTGQVCADSVGTRFYSGIGGQVDFNRGAARSRGGRAIIAMPSTARAGSVSRIVSRLSPGAGVVTSRGDVHYVITEYGIAYLHGKSIQQRALALISIAHPEYRPRLLREAIEFRFLPRELADVENRLQSAPVELRTDYVMHNGMAVHFRPVEPTDEPRVRELFYQMSERSVYYRFMRALQRLPVDQLQDLVYVDHRSEISIVGTVPESFGEDVIAIGGYYLDPKTNWAEMAIIVRDDWQGQGIGTFLLRYLIDVAREHGISGFTAEVLRNNRAMMAAIEKSGYAYRTRLAEDVLEIEIHFQKQNEEAQRSAD